MDQTGKYIESTDGAEKLARPHLTIDASVGAGRVVGVKASILLLLVRQSSK
tara:strand:- start:55 stop:207 length:153 start_codon:yes stop_codon:yes gene_type:complete